MKEMYRETHIKARTEKAEGYPERLFVPEGTTWDDVSESTYNPPQYTAQKIIDRNILLNPENPKDFYADPVEVSLVGREFQSYEGEVRIDENGYPLNPKGPTGLSGRGILGKWGANFAADPIITQVEDGYLKMIAIKRSTGEDALPGGMADPGESRQATASRELDEESSAQLNLDDAVLVYQGYVDDPRNTDNSWMETDAYHLHVEGFNPQLKAGDDAKEAGWKILSQEFIGSLYASHAHLVTLAVNNWQYLTGNSLSEDGRVKS